MIRLSRREVEQASDDAIILVEGSEAYAYIVERQSDGGIIHPAATDDHMCYPICMAKQPGNRLEAGDWVVVPYVKASPNSPATYGRDGCCHKIEWVD